LGVEFLHLTTTASPLCHSSFLTVLPVCSLCVFVFQLKEQEIRNLVWISECIVQQQKDEIHKFVPTFSLNAPWRTGR
jgi:vacuolar-type H+-ATPase subunit C/Vma6